MVWIFTISGLSQRENQEEKLLDFETIHGTDYLKVRMFQAQKLDNFEEINSAFINLEMKKHNEAFNEVVCCIKVSVIFLEFCIY